MTIATYKETREQLDTKGKEVEIRKGFPRKNKDTLGVSHSRQTV